MYFNFQRNFKRKLLMIQCYEAVEGNTTQEFGKISKIKSFETIINDSSETSVWIGNWLAATSVSSLHVSPKYLKRHKKSWKHKTKLKTRYTVDLMLELTLIICQTTQDWEKNTMRAYLMKHFGFSSWNQNHLNKGRRCFAYSQTHIPGCQDLALVPKRNW